MPSLETGRIIEGDAVETMQQMRESSVHAVSTSIPYYGLRDYGEAVETVWGGDEECDHDWTVKETPQQGGTNNPDNPPNTGANTAAQDTRIRGEGIESDFCQRCGAWRGQFGLEPSLELYVRHVVEAFEAVRRVLRPDGNCFLNIGDSFASKPRGNKDPVASTGLNNNEESFDAYDAGQDTTGELGRKQKMLVPHRVAIALQDAGWVVRGDYVWSKPNPTPHPVKDRLREDKEFVFHLTPEPDYWFDLDVIREPHKEASLERNDYAFNSAGIGSTHAPREDRVEDVVFDAEDACHPNGKNPGDVLEIATKPYAHAHYAVYPEELPEPFIRAACSPEVCPDCGSPVVWWATVRDETRWWWVAGRRETWLRSRADDLLAEPPDDDVLEAVVAHEAVERWRAVACDCDTDGTEAGVVLDPFAGTGTTCRVAKDLGRRWVGIDLDPESVALAQRDLGVDVDRPELLPEREDGQVGVEAFADGGGD